MGGYHKTTKTELYSGTTGTILPHTAILIAPVLYYFDTNHRILMHSKQDTGDIECSNCYNNIGTQKVDG